MEKTVAIVAGGQLVDSFIPYIRKCSVIIGVDYGAYWLLSKKVIPHVVIGDFDSVTKTEFAEITRQVSSIIKHPKVKDKTDMELALDYVDLLSPSDVRLYGGFGTRLDHSLGTIFLLEKKKKSQYRLRLFTETSEATVVLNSYSIQKSRYQYVSFISLSQLSIISLTGFLYCVHKKRIYRGQTIGISNELVKKKGKVTVSLGTVLVVQSNDKPIL